MHNKTKRLHIKKKQLSIIIASVFISQLLLAADFTISSGQIETTPQFLVNDNETGSIVVDVELGGASKEDYVNDYAGLEYTFQDDAF